MSGIEHLVEQHIREYESRQKHVDELIERAHGHAGDTEGSTELSDIKQQRDKLSGELEKLKRRALSDWERSEIEQAGPLGIWSALAQQLEKLVERLER